MDTPMTLDEALTAFRALMEKMNAHFDDLPRNSFSTVGTNVNTLLLQVFKDGRSFYR